MPVINLHSGENKEWARGNSRRKPETVLIFLCEVFWDMSHHPNKVYKPRAPWWPGIYPNETSHPGMDPVPFPPASTNAILLLPPRCPRCPIQGSLDPELMPLKTVLEKS